MKKEKGKGREKRKGNSLFGCKKGTLFDLFPILMFCLVFGILCFTGLKIYNEFNDSGAVTSSTGLDIMEKAESAHSTLDGIFMFLIVGLSIGVIVSAVQIRSSPAFFFISVLLLSVVIFLSAQFSNIFTKMTSSNLFTTEGTTYSLLSGTMNNLPFISLGIGLLILLVLYSVNRFDV